MKHRYTDILRLTKVAPQWWDENGTPRYCDFKPWRCPNIYNVVTALLHIKCQNCSREFLVEVSRSPDVIHQRQLMGEARYLPLSDWLSYGDPPAHNCIGDTEMSVEVALVELWVESPNDSWKRIRAHEGQLPTPSWFEPSEGDGKS